MLGAAREIRTSARGAVRWCCTLLPAAFAVWLYLPVTDGGLLADELLLASYVVEMAPEGPQPAWQQVADDFSGPWAFGNGNYYRPLVTLSLVVDQWMSDGSESMSHVTSIALFAVCVFSLAWLLAVLFGWLSLIHI